ncbi:hypothetical protein EZL74_04140 [Flavobacterium silvisoli]|uniref:Uncharacterized protein n=1 Tax=Flavobacterium silvisoli TaxID=2529433 RepID=A0A4Q9Z242_9FLAO|nr:hypothetical protein [Flavobacterium silvisoli]TBX70373.1 hypothetical protein EZL74_04140 [Flavobacterium silvisoli]
MRNYIWFVFALVALSFASCQDEEESVKQSAANSFGKSSAISSLISRVSQFETTCDNVLDNTSNFSVKLPVHVTVNSQYCYVNSSALYPTVQSYKDNYAGDDVVHFQFPITLVYPDHQEVLVNSETEYNAILAAMGDDSNYHEIDCINFQYPFTINKYNTNNQLAGSVTVTSDAQLYDFIHDLTATEIVGIVYPLSLKKTNSSSVITVTSNSQLEDAIDNAVFECTTGPMPLEVEEVLTSGTWRVSYCYYTHDETYYYANYNFTFNSNETVKAVKNSTVIYGDWDVHDEYGYQRLDLHFDGSTLEDLESNWRVLEVSSTFVRLKSESSSSGQYYYLSFTKN